MSSNTSAKMSITTDLKSECKSIAQDGNDSAVDMTFSTSRTPTMFPFHDQGNHGNNHPMVNQSSADYITNTFTPNPARNETSHTPLNVVHVHGMPFSTERLMEMGNALATARREKTFPATITPAYNVQAVIDDYDALQRLNDAREMEGDARDHAFSSNISRLYIEVQRRIQDRDLIQGEVAAESNVRARLNGLANGTGTETGMYNLMRHAVQSVLRLNNLALENEDNLVDSGVTRIIDTIRNTVQTQINQGSHGVDGVNIDGVMDNVFGAIEDALSQGVGTQANRLDGQINNMSGITNNMSGITNNMSGITNNMSGITNNMNNITEAHTVQVNAIASHVNAINNHVHAMGNNVTALSTNVVTLQTVVNIIPQMVSNAVRDMLPAVLPEIIGLAVEQAFERANSNELLHKMQIFVNAMEETRIRAERNVKLNNAAPPNNKISHKKTTKHSWRSAWGFFEKRSNHHNRPISTAY